MKSKMGKKAEPKIKSRFVEKIVLVDWGIELNKAGK